MANRLAWAALLLTAVCGCQWNTGNPEDDYETVARDPRRDTHLARRHNAEAVALLEGEKLDAAEKELKAALAADLFFGPSHNNLGTVYYRQGKHYLAAWEFQYAIKLMPRKPQPRNNLGLVFEAVGKLDDAQKWYEEALELEPDTPEIIGNLARARLKAGRKDKRTRELLQEIVLKDTRPKWIGWARERLALMGRAAPPTTRPASTP